MKLPLISIITVCYNAADALHKTMKSVDTQTYPDIEYIIIDGGSTDSTVNMLKNHTGRLDKWISEKTTAYTMR